MVQLYEATRARYLLVGKVMNQSVNQSLITTAERYGTGQTEDLHENWVTLTFTLYDLATSQVALELHTRTRAGRYHNQEDDGSVVSYHAPINLLDKAFEKSMDKLNEVCKCER